MQPILTSYHLGTHVTAFSTTRQGGCSKGAYGEFNINCYCGDDVEHIRKNRLALCQLLGINDDQLIMPHQVHDTVIATIDEAFLQLSASKRQEQLEGVDALMTNIPGICIGVSTADCIPVLLYDPKHQAAAAIHAGWRGTVKRIVEKTVQQMTATYGSQPSYLMAQIAPGIHLDSFEVGDEVYESFASEGFPMNLISKRYPFESGSIACHTLHREKFFPFPSSLIPSKWHIDLPECNRLQLLSSGLSAAHISVSPICTYEHHDLFFSARRLGINNGRIFTGIIITSSTDYEKFRNEKNRNIETPFK